MAASRSGGETMDCLRNSSRPMTSGAAATTATVSVVTMPPTMAEMEEMKCEASTS